MCSRVRLGGTKELLHGRMTEGRNKERRREKEEKEKEKKKERRKEKLPYYGIQPAFSPCCYPCSSLHGKPLDVTGHQFNGWWVQTSVDRDQGLVDGQFGWQWTAAPGEFSASLFVFLVHSKSFLMRFLSNKQTFRYKHLSQNFPLRHRFAFCVVSLGLTADTSGIKHAVRAMGVFVHPAPPATFLELSLNFRVLSLHFLGIHRCRRSSPPYRTRSEHNQTPNSGACVLVAPAR